MRTSSVRKRKRRKNRAAAGSFVSLELVGVRRTYMMRLANR
jgi:hypothetical protein